jgi:hypothetical protein
LSSSVSRDSQQCCNASSSAISVSAISRSASGGVDGLLAPPPINRLLPEADRFTEDEPELRTDEDDDDRRGVIWDGEPDMTATFDCNMS